MISLLFCLFTQTTLASPVLSSDPYNAYQWQGDENPWYEWWYYKVVHPQTGRSFYFVYGVVNPWDHSKSMAGTNAAVAVGDFSQKKIIEQKFSVNEFTASRDTTLVRVGPDHSQNIATDNQIQGHILDDQGNTADWNLTIEKDWGFNAMGWGMQIPEAFNIYWYPAQASAFISGDLVFNGETIHFDRALGYQDRNWGRSLPKWWAWLVSNNFKNSPGTVLAAGGGEPKVLGREIYKGMSIGLRHRGVEYSFRPNDGAIVQTDISFGKWEVTATKLFKYKITLSAWAPAEKFMLLPFISPDGTVFKDMETLNGNIKVRLYEFVDFGQWQEIANLESDEAGIEYGSY